MKATSFQPMCGTFSPGACSATTAAGQQPQPAIAARARWRRRTAAACPGTGRGPASPPPRARPRARRGRARASRASRPAKAPTPGTTSPSAARSASWSAVSAARAPTCSSAFSTRGGCPCRNRRSPIVVTVSVPLVEGTPVSVGSMATAARSARAKALNAASIMWWALVPASTLTCRVMRAALATARKNSSASSWSKPPVAARRQVGVEVAVRAPGDVDRAGRARLVHRHRRGAVADDPGAVAQRPVERLAEDDPGVLDGVVRAGLQVAADLDVEVEPAVAGQQVEHVVEEADAGRARARAGAVEGQRERDARSPWCRG